MRVLQNNAQVRDRTIAGNKAATLAKLQDAGFDIPLYFVIAADPGHQSVTALQSEIELSTNEICSTGQQLAVRSSSCEEDGERLSFAGQFDTFLHVEPHDVLSFAIKVTRSATSSHIDAYRKAQETGGDPPRPAVVVQRMVKADASGVAFAADPVSGDAAQAVVAAIDGTGESLVSGEDQGDTWHIDRRGRVISSDTRDRRPVLNARQLNEVVKLVRAVSEFVGRPQDIEWAFEGPRLYLLQSRDITTLHDVPAPDSYALWDNSNIVESYGGVTTPLTFSVARSAYQEAYRHMGRALGVSEHAITLNARAYEQMIGLIQGRVYYNLLNWYRLLMLTPGFRFNRRFMEQMMGVTAGLPANAVPRPADKGKFARVRAAAGLFRVAERLLAKLFVHNSRVRKFHREIEDALKPVELKSMSLNQLLDTYEALQGRVIPAWDTPLINDLYCMIFHGALRHLCEKWLDDDLAGIHNDLVSGESGIISVEPVRRMQQLAAIAASDGHFVNALCERDLQTIDFLMGKKQAFRAGYCEYLEKFGDRCLDELKLESATLNDNPLPLLRAIGQLARSGMRGPASTAQDALRMAAEDRSAASFGGKVFRRHVFSFVLGLARARVRDRENLRFERTRVYGRVRSIFVEIGRRLSDLGVINEVIDIFYLDVAEITGLIRGTGMSASLSQIVDNRRREFAAYQDSDGPPRRFVTIGPAQLASSLQEVPGEDVEESDDHRTGQACSQGIVRGRVRIVRDPRRAEFAEGEILVAERTDPGWVTIFPLVSGMIMERGSLLSHSAIVARELGIPAVVGVDKACNWLNDGDWVELNGATGLIRRVNATDKAA